MEVLIGGLLAVLFVVFVGNPYMKGCEQREDQREIQAHKNAPKECKQKCLEYGQSKFVLNPYTHECLCRFE